MMITKKFRKRKKFVMNNKKCETKLIKKYKNVSHFLILWYNINVKQNQ